MFCMFNAWSRFLDLSSSWLRLVVAIWIVFATMLSSWNLWFFTPFA